MSMGERIDYAYLINWRVQGPSRLDVRAWYDARAAVGQEPRSPYRGSPYISRMFEDSFMENSLRLSTRKSGWALQEMAKYAKVERAPEHFLDALMLAFPMPLEQYCLDLNKPAREAREREIKAVRAWWKANGVGL